MWFYIGIQWLKFLLFYGLIDLFALCLGEQDVFFACFIKIIWFNILEWAGVKSKIICIYINIHTWRYMHIHTYSCMCASVCVYDSVFNKLLYFDLTVNKKKKHLIQHLIQLQIKRFHWSLVDNNVLIFKIAYLLTICLMYFKSAFYVFVEL